MLQTSRRKADNMGADESEDNTQKVSDVLLAEGSQSMRVVVINNNTSMEKKKLANIGWSLV